MVMCWPNSSSSPSSNSPAAYLATGNASGSGCLNRIKGRPLLFGFRSAALVPHPSPPRKGGHLTSSRGLQLRACLPVIMDQLVTNDDAVKPRPRLLPTPTLRGARCGSFHVLLGFRRGKLVPTVRTSRRGTRLEAATTIACSEQGLQRRFNHLTVTDLDTLRHQLGVVVEYRSATARVAICVGRLVEAVVDEVVLE